LQNHIPGPLDRPFLSQGESLPQRGLPALERAEPFATWRMARVIFLREMARESLSAISQHKKVACHLGQGVGDSLPSGSGNLNIHLGRQRLPFAHPL